MNTPSYKDEDLVYVDPKLRAVVGLVEFDKDGKPLPKEMEIADAPPPPGEEEDKGKKRRFRKRKPKKRCYPWGTYKTMKKIYRIEGKVKDSEESIPLEEAIAKAMQEPYWD